MAVVFVAFLVMLVSMFFWAAVAVGVAHQLPSLSRIPAAELADDPRVLLPAQLAAYFMVLGGLWRLFSHHFRIGFFRALAWRWPARWPWFLAGGALLAVAVELSSNFLPSPPEMPIDKMLRTPADAWLMSLFGVFIAPFVEEVLFRGLLFPALARRSGAVFSLAVTSVLFGAIHAQQLAGAWIQVTCIVFVGTVLTLIRWRFRSLASSTLVHVGYNGALFVALFVQTSGFTHFAAK
jgi:membrane protease YdiL (CAAX protease family)